GEKVTGPLPTGEVVGRIAPGRALVGLVARQEIEEERGLVERPARTPLAATPENLAEELFARAASEEDVLSRRVLIAVAGGDRDPLDAERLCHVEEVGDLLRLLVLKQGAVDGAAEALGTRELDRRDRLVEHPLLTDRLVVPLAVAVEVHGEREIGRGLVLVDVLGEQDGVGAEVDEALARDDPGHDLRHLLVDERLTSGDGHHRRPALIDGVQRVFHGDPLLQGLFRIVDLAAAGAGEVALEQRLEHEHQWIALLPAQLLADDVARDAVLLNQWNTQNPAPVDCPGCVAAGFAPKPKRGRAQLETSAEPAPCNCNAYSAAR